MKNLTLIPTYISDANEFVRQHHRHHKPPQGALFAVAVGDNTTIHGVAIIGRPTARNSDDGWTAEITRVATDGTANCCSMLYGAAWRAARALGYKKIITYTLSEEGGASLRAGNYRLIGECGGGSWNRSSRPRVDKAPLQRKLKWEKL